MRTVWVAVLLFHSTFPIELNNITTDKTSFLLGNYYNSHYDCIKYLEKELKFGINGFCAETVIEDK